MDGQVLGLILKYKNEGYHLMHKHYDVVSIGDLNIDLIVVGCEEIPGPGQEIMVENMHVHIGGGAALFSMALAKLGLRLAVNGVLGDDRNGSYIIDQFRQLNIDTSYIRLSRSNKTGISIAINPENDRSFITYTGTNAEVSLDSLDEESMRLGRHVHLTGYKGSRNHAEYMELVRRLKGWGISVSFDVGWDESGEWYEGIFELVSLVDVFFLNKVEALNYARAASMEEAIRKFSARSPHVVFKMGPEGALAVRGVERVYRSAYCVQVRDTTGAGDSFNAGYIYGMLTGKPVGQSLEYGNACGAMSVGSYGGSTGISDEAGVREFIAQHAHQVSDTWESVQIQGGP